MLYCFVIEDLDNISNDDPLYLQYLYASEIGRKCCLSITDERFVEGSADEEEKIYLR